jgi:hypothetical protein
VRSGVFLRAIAVSPFALRLLTIAWLALLIVATQIPQRYAPLTTSDGLSRADLRFIETVGLDQLGDSMVLWLLVTLSIIVMVARWLFATAPGGHAVALESATSEQRLGRLHEEMKTWLQRHPMRWAISLRRRRDGGIEKLELGAARWGRWLLAFAAVGFVLTWIGSSMGASPVLFEVRLANPDKPAVAHAQVAEAGRLVAARPGCSGSCQDKDKAISCQLDLWGDRGQVELTPTRTGRLGRWRVAWVGRAVDPHGVDARLHWRIPAKSTPGSANNSQRWYALDVVAGRTVDVPDLEARITSVRRDTAGWMFFGQRGRDKSVESFAMAAPTLLPAGVSAARYSAPAKARLLATPALSGLLLIIWTGLGLIAALSMILLPTAEIAVDLDAGVVEVRSCNRLALRRLALELLVVVSVRSGDSMEEPQ